MIGQGCMLSFMFHMNTSIKFATPKPNTSASRSSTIQNIQQPSIKPEQAQAETKLGKVANEYMSRGEMLPTDVVLSLVIKRLAQRDCVQNGWILDGKRVLFQPSLVSLVLSSRFDCTLLSSDCSLHMLNVVLGFAGFCPSEIENFHEHA